MVSNLEFEKLKEKFHKIKKKIDYDQLLEQLHQIELQMKDESFWNDVNNASNISAKQKELTAKIKTVDHINSSVEELNFLIKELPEEEDEIDKTYVDLQKKIEELEIDSLLNDEYDNNNIYLEIHPGAGGVESHDFAFMLQEMYQKYFTKKGYSYEIIDYHKGDVAGTKSITYEVKGTNLFGLFKRETGIHRLIRLSPFDSGNRRHTSFASVKVTPIIETTDFHLDENELKIDTFRSSGAGGQSVNTTDSAVRITHVPTGIVVTCQNERSQIQNKEQALKILVSKLVIINKQQQDEVSKGAVGELKSNSFGSQKRTYTLHPYKLVKDHISGYETTQVDKVLQGDLDDFIYANLLNTKE